MNNDAIVRRKPSQPSILFFLAATDLINNLLQVKMRKRYSVDKSLSHPWLQVPERTRFTLL